MCCCRSFCRTIFAARPQPRRHLLLRRRDCRSGGFAGSFAGALLGVAIGTVCSDLSLGLDGALLGWILATVAGAVYGLFLALRERKRAARTEDALS